VVAISVREKHVLDVLRLETERIKPALDVVFTNAGVEANWRISCCVYEHTDCPRFDFIDVVCYPHDYLPLLSFRFARICEMIAPLYGYFDTLYQLFERCVNGGRKEADLCDGAITPD
jgi:hypothetical protein